jgi:hypothetical protein
MNWFVIISPNITTPQTDSWARRKRKANSAGNIRKVGTTMYWNISRSAIVAAVLCALSSVSVSQATRQCTNADVNGSYGFYYQGTNVGLKVNMLMMGRLDADGKGNFKGTESEIVAGKAGGGPFAGTYTVHPDCTGSADLTFEGSNVQAQLNFVLVADGNEMYLLDSGSNMESGEAKRQFGKSRK